MSTHYTFCPQCGTRYTTTPAQAKQGIQCIECQAKFFPDKISRSSEEGVFLSVVGIVLAVAGVAGCIASFFGSSNTAAVVGGAALSAGVSLIVLAQLFHIRAAIEQFNNERR